MEPSRARHLLGSARRARPAIIILLIAFALRVAAVLITPHYVARFDAADYLRLGRELASGHDMTTIPSIFRPGYSAFRPPLYPILLAAVAKAGGGVTAMRITGAVIGTGSVALFGLVAREIWGRRTALVAMGIAAVYPSFIVLDCVLYSEVLFLPFLLIALWCGLRAMKRRSLRWAALAGVAAGAAAEVRPNGFLVIVAIAVAMLAGSQVPVRRRLIGVAVLLVAAFVVMTPWTVRNDVRLHRFIPVSDASGFDLSGTFNAEEAASHSYPGSFLPPEYVKEFQPLFTTAQLDEPALSARLGSAARTYAEHHPRYVLRVMGGNSLRMFGAVSARWFETEAELMNLGPRGGIGWFVGGWLLLAAGVVVTPWIRRSGVPLVLVAVAVLFWLPSALTAYGDPRYREPLEVSVVLLVASGVATAFPARLRR